MERMIWVSFVAFLCFVLIQVLIFLSRQTEEINILKRVYARLVKMVIGRLYKVDFNW